MHGLVVTVSVDIHTPAARVWQALTDPEQVKKFMFGAQVVTDWKEGSDIVYRGEWEGKAYEDKGKIVKIVPQELLATTHFSPIAGKPDVPENYQNVRYKLVGAEGKTTLTITQDNNATEAARRESEKNWRAVANGIKKVAER